MKPVMIEQSEFGLIGRICLFALGMMTFMLTMN